MENIKEQLENLEIGKIQKYKNLAIAPILGSDSGLEHMALCDALNDGLVITEKGYGTVPTLEVVNRTGKKVIAIAGEYIKGGMQNRAIVRSAYLDESFKGDIPVRCVQQGRWHYEGPGIPSPINPVRPRRPRGPHFPGPIGPISFDDMEFPSSIPECTPAGENGRFKHGGHTPICAYAEADSQGETWRAVNQVLGSSGVKSLTSDLNEVYTKKREEFEKYRKNFSALENQIGNVAVISNNDNKTVTFVLDIFDRPEIFSKYHNNLINSYALEAGLNAKNKVKTSESEVRDFIRCIDSCTFNEQKPVSVGQDYRIKGNGFQGSALSYENNLVYMNFFNREFHGKGSEVVEHATETMRENVERKFRTLRTYKG